MFRLADHTQQILEVVGVSGNNKLIMAILRGRKGYKQKRLRRRPTTQTRDSNPEPSDFFKKKDKEQKGR